jgi:hypothetical protein
VSVISDDDTLEAIQRYGFEVFLSYIPCLSSSTRMPATPGEQQLRSSESSLAESLLKLDRDVFAVAIFGFNGRLQAYAAKDFFAREHRSESSLWEKAAQRHAAVVKLANEDYPETNSATGIVFFRKEYKHILVPIPRQKIIVEAVMPLWNHSTVFFDSVQRYFEKEE